MIHPAIIAFWAYGFLALLIGVWAAARSGRKLEFVAALVPFALWLTILAAQLALADLSEKRGEHFELPVWAYLVMDVPAAVGFYRCQPWGSRALAWTFAAQIALELGEIVAGGDALLWWWTKWASAMVQLGVVAVLAGRSGQAPSRQ